MLFNSISFLIFFPIVCLIYFAIPNNCNKIRNSFLLFASYYFYMNWEPAYALLLLTSTFITYSASIGIGHFQEKKLRKLCLVSSIVLNLSILFLFKYYNFITENVLLTLQTCHLSIDMPKFTLLLPVGISFYTFQALGYSIDVYKGTTKIERSFFTYALFVSFFPQLVAGPIERSNNLLPQFKEKHTIDYDRIMNGLRLMVWGYFMKLVLADRCAIYVDVIFNHVGAHNGGSYLIASLLFPFQIYGDFAGYSLIAIGVANVLGFRLMENFHHPYFACTIGDFWHRWHISLSTWFKDYVYIPLGGNRVSKARCYLNLFVTFVVSGIWHGANWTFFLWGSLHGVLLCIEKACNINKKKFHGISRLFQWCVTFILVCFAWIIFRANNIQELLEVLSNIFTNLEYPNEMQFGIFLAIMATLVILFIKEYIEEFKPSYYQKLISNKILMHLYFILMIPYIILFGVFRGDQFIYFQF